MKRTVVIRDKLNANLSPAHGGNGAFVSSFYAAGLLCPSLRLWDILHAINDEEVGNMKFESICELLLASPRPLMLTLLRPHKRDLMVKDFRLLVSTDLLPPEDKDIVHQYVCLQEVKAVLHSCASGDAQQLRAMGHEMLESRFPGCLAPGPECLSDDAILNAEAHIEGIFAATFFPLLAAVFQSSARKALDDEDSCQGVLSFLPSARTHRTVAFIAYTHSSASPHELRLLHNDVTLRELVYAMHFSRFLADADSSAVPLPHTLSIHRCSDTPLLPEPCKPLDVLAVLELLNSKFLCVLLTSLLLERSVLIVYTSAKNYTVVSEFMTFLRQCLRPLTWIHLEDPIASNALLDSPFPFLAGMPRNQIDESSLGDFKAGVTIFDLDYVTFHFPLPKDVNRSIHVLKGLQRDIDLVLRPRLYQCRENFSLGPENKVERVAALCSSFVADLTSDSLLRRAGYTIDDTAALMDEGAYVEAVHRCTGFSHMSKDFLADLLRTQHFSNRVIDVFFCPSKKQP